MIAYASSLTSLPSRHLSEYRCLFRESVRGASQLRLESTFLGNIVGLVITLSATAWSIRRGRIGKNQAIEGNSSNGVIETRSRRLDCSCYPNSEDRKANG